jgi:hypothetical protein
MRRAIDTRTQEERDDWYQDQEYCRKDIDTNSKRRAIGCSSKWRKPLVQDKSRRAIGTSNKRRKIRKDPVARGENHL